MLDEKILREIQEYVDSYINEDFALVVSPESFKLEETLQDIHNDELEDFIKTNRKPLFNQVLFSFIEKIGASDPEIYNKAGIDRKLFSKIRNSNYRPGKNTVIALALALELNIEETDSLLSSAGYSLSDSDTYDLVLQFCLEKKIYNIHDVNQALDYFSLKPLIGSL
ncbi:hypothetical protein [Bacillus sp. CECT 9360]|uniref:hypothetical protein n=1 Tax=Bacillus sp. CECT 9360 TaxID=2845821 RepID=UPI001E5803BE|nr:hypothetical protein [Bacillus sp. CECT 9360]CAH0345448.1 hypothetical protein BCI9360_01734 [Bacillus sp. CECT 9360]